MKPHSWCLAALIALASSGCLFDDAEKPPPAAPTATAPTPPAVVYDSGRGTGPYDAMTYSKYSSDILLTPLTEITVTAIRPQVWYCNGTSGFLVHIRDEHYQPLASEAGIADGTGYSTPTFADRQLDTPLVMEAGITYRIVMEVWTTKSIGIFTTGERTDGVVGSATYSVQSANSDTYDHLDRGGIALELLQ